MNMKKLLKNKKIIAILVGVILIIALIIFFISKNNLSELEESEIKEMSDIVVNYLEEIENVELTEYDGYINYALEYYYNEKEQSVVSIADVVTLINDTFSLDVTEKEIEKMGITPLMVDKNITYDSVKKEFFIDKESLSYADIAEISIIKYDLKDINKKNKKEIVVTYNKYEVVKPYDILNYYTNLNLENSVSNEEKVDKDSDKEKIDTSEILSYLKGEASRKVIKKYINEDIAKEIAGYKGEVKVTYTIGNNKVLISNIEGTKKGE